MNRLRKKRKLHSYTLDFKLQAIQFVKIGNSKESAARKFGVDSRRIREWCSPEERLKSAASSPKTSVCRRLDGGGRHPLSKTLEQDLYAWIEEKRSNRLRVTRSMVKKEAVKRFGNSPACDNRSTNFVASEGWLQNFFCRHGITLRHKTTVSQHIPEKVSVKVASYLYFVQSLCLKKNIPLSQIGAMDKTPVWLDMTAETTIDLLARNLFL